MTNAVNIDNLREQIVQRYRALPELRQRIVQLLSVIYSPISRVTFLECLKIGRASCRERV